MEKLIEVVFSVGIVIVIIAAVCLAPMIFLWSINTLAALGGAEFYIPHTVWSYWVTVCFLVVIKGINSNSKNKS
jgi:hypothetical protein